MIDEWNPSSPGEGTDAEFFTARGRHLIGSLEMISHESHEKNPGWLGYTGDYTTQLYRDYNKPL